MACVYLLFVWASIPGMKTLSSNVFFSYCLRLAAHTNTSMMTHIEHRTSLTSRNIAHQISIEDETQCTHIFDIYGEKSPQYIKVCALQCTLV